MTIKAHTRSIEKLSEKANAIATETRELQAMLARHTGLELLVDIAEKVKAADGSFFGLDYGIDLEQPWRLVVFLGSEYTHPEVKGANTIERSGADLHDVCVATLKMLDDVTQKEEGQG